MIKSMLLYRVTNQLHVDLLNDYIELGEKLATKPEAFPTGSQWQRSGFAPLNPDVNEDLVWVAPGGVSVLTYMIHERALTGATVREYVLARGKKLEEREGRKVYKKEYAQIKDEVVAELLPKAFIKHKRIQILVMGNLLVIGATTAKVAEQVLCDLRECLDGLAVVPYTTKVAPQQWFADLTRKKKGLLTAGDSAKLVNDVKDTVTFKGVDLSEDEQQSYVQTGFTMKEMGMWLGTEMYFKVTDTLIFKGIKFAEDLLRVSREDADGDVSALLDADVMLVADSIRKLIAEIDVQIGEEVPKMRSGEEDGSGLVGTVVSVGEPTGHLEDLLSDEEKLASLQDTFGGSGDDLIDDDEDF